MSDVQVALDTTPGTISVQAAGQSDHSGPAPFPLSSDDICQRIESVGIIPFLRVTSAKDALFAADMLAGAGLPVCELGMSSPETSTAEALDILSHLVKHLPKTLVGAGNVFDTDTARRCLDLGAAFLSCDGLVPQVVELATKADAVVIAGALTPSEVIAASLAGSDFVKLCPISAVNGSSYIRSMKHVLPRVRFIAAGGVTERNAFALLEAGACAVCVGEALIPEEAIRLRQHGRIRELTKRFLSFAGHCQSKKRPQS